jgi:hypothetical protein
VVALVRRTVIKQLVAEPELRGRVEDELPALPLAYFQAQPSVPDRWAERAHCAYLQFSPAYDAEAATAKARSWPVKLLSGEHLHMLADPARVSRQILELFKLPDCTNL